MSNQNLLQSKVQDEKKIPRHHDQSEPVIAKSIKDRKKTEVLPDMDFDQLLQMVKTEREDEKKAAAAAAES